MNLRIDLGVRRVRAEIPFADSVRAFAAERVAHREGWADACNGPRLAAPSAHRDGGVELHSVASCRQ
jgi:hypothetical protein